MKRLALYLRLSLEDEGEKDWEYRTYDKDTL